MRNVHGAVSVLSILGLFVVMASCDSNVNVVSKVEQKNDSLLEVGAKIAQATQKTLGMNLKNAIAEGGAHHAISFCNEKAMPLTDSLSAQFHAQIRRVSHRNRNPLNKPTAIELEWINEMLQQHANGDTSLSAIRESDGRTFYVAPIKMQGICLSCHGSVGGAISQSTDSLIKSHYPEDNATGFAMGDIRGMWSIEFLSKVE